MSRKHEVSIHPDKAKIDKALIKGVSYRKIAEQFGTSQAAICRYLNDKLIPQMSKAQATRELQGGSDLLDRLESYITIADKMIKAAEEYLQDPDDPNKLILTPHAGELEISYTEYKKGKQIKNKGTLQELIDKIENKDLQVGFVRYKHEDPRRTILNAANTLSKQLELFAKIHGDIKTVSLNLTLQPAYNTFVEQVILATDKFPEVRRHIVNAVKSIRSVN